MEPARCGGCVIAAAPEAGGELGVLAGFAIALSALLMWVACRGLLQAWRFSFGAIFEAIGGVGINIKWAPDIHPFSFLKAFSETVENNLTTAAKGYETAMGYWFHQAARLQLWIVDETWKLARDTLHFGDFLVTTYIPHRIHDATHSLHTTTRTLVKTVTKVERIIVHAPAAAKATARAAVATTIPGVVIPHIGELKWIHSHWRAITRAVAAAGAIAAFPPVAIPRIWHGIDELRHRLGRIEKRVTKTEALFGATALSIAMANVLGIPNPRCLRKGPVGRVARSLCGMSATALNDLLGLLVDVLIVADICDVITLLNEGLTVIEGPLADLTGVVGAALCHGDYAEPPELPSLPLYLPSKPALVLSGV